MRMVCLFRLLALARSSALGACSSCSMLWMELYGRRWSEESVSVFIPFRSGMRSCDSLPIV